MTWPVALCLSLSAFAALPPDSGGGSPPNIVVFLVDDLGWQDTEVDLAHPKARAIDWFRTPHIRALAEEGVRFTNAYASAVCSPSRTSLLTGLNAARHRVTQWTLFPDRDPSGSTDRLGSPADWKKEGLQPGAVTLPGLLRDRGYRTIHVGKAHFGAKGTPGEDPRALGFDVNIAGHGAGGPGGYSGLDGFGRDKPPWAVPGLEPYHELPVNLTDALTVEANRAVEEAVAEGRPFFLYFAHYAVHAPIQPHEAYVGRYREAGVDEQEARYASMVESVDASFGSVIENLKRLGVAKDTVVAFTSDNGGLTVHSRGTTSRGTGKDTHNWPLRSGKGSAYEGGIRVPLFFGFAERDDEHPLQREVRIARGADVDAPAIIEDLFPTVLSLASCLDEVPPEHAVDGRDLTGLLRGSPDDSASWANRPLLFHYPHVWGPFGDGYEPHTSIRMGSHKLIYFYQPRRVELYDLARDPGERHDLASSKPDLVDDLFRSMLRLLEERGALFPENRELGLPEAPVLLHVVERGEGGDGRLPLVFIHGWSCDHFTFQPQIEDLSRDRRVLAIDLPGHGRSRAPVVGPGGAVYSVAVQADLVAGELERRSIERAVIVAHSNGCTIAREMARRHPSRCAGFVFLDGALLPVVEPEMVETTRGIIEGAHRARYLESVAAYSFPPDLDPETRKRLARPIMDTPPDVQVAALLANADPRVWREEVRFAAPVLAVYARQPLWDEAYLQRVRELCEDADVEVWEGVSHFLMWSAPNRLNARLREWLSEHGL